MARRHDANLFFEELTGAREDVGAVEAWTMPGPRLPAYHARAYAPSPYHAEGRYDDESYAPETTATRWFQLRVDADRDGRVDANDPPTTWTWGAAGSGAVILANFDNDPSGTNPDASDRIIDGGNDAADDIAPLVIEPVGTGGSPPAGTRLELTASPANAIRIFATRTAGATEIVGPAAGATHRFTTLPTTRLELGMEATRYAGDGFDGIIEIRLRTIPPGGGTPIEQRTCVRVSPWIMPNHTHDAEKVFVVDAGAFNQTFRTELRRLITAAGCTLVETTTGGGRDIWMQDVMEFGVSNLPARGFRTVFRSKQARDLSPFPRSLLAPELGFHGFTPPPIDSTFDSHGNLEATPAVTVRGKRYRFGRIYYGPGRTGEPLDPEVRAFLRGQIVQEPIEVDTSWLAVGHVDEIISWVPTNATSGRRFKMLIASPRRAYALLDGLARTNPTARMFIGKSLAQSGTPTAEITVRALLAANDDINPELRARVAAGRIRRTAGTLRAYNDARQADLDRVRATMVRELELADADIIEIPSLFMPNSRTPSVADALVPGMVNMLVVNRHCIVPKPFGPVVGGSDKLEDDVRSSLQPLGLTVSFLDCWETYHINLGEVHCGTNTLRTPNRGRWWLFQP